MKQSMVLVLDPRFKTGNEPLLSDYHTVPRLTTIGTWPIVDLLPIEILAKLQSMTGVKRRKK